MNPQLVEITNVRHNYGIDPAMHIWGWEIPVYLFLGGVVAGIMFVGAGLELYLGHKPKQIRSQVMPFVAAALLSLGMGTLFLDLAHKLYVWRFYLSFQVTSPMSWGSWILLIVYPVMILHGLGSLNPNARAWLSEKLGALGGLLQRLYTLADEKRGVVLWASILAGGALGVYTGLLLGTLSARFQWDSAVLGPLFLTSGVSTGAAALLLLNPSHDEADVLLRFDAIAIAAELTLLLVMVIGFWGGDATDHLAAHNLLGGPYTPYFWSIVVVLGLATPLAMDLAEMRRRYAPTIISPLLVLIGGYALRALMVASGQHSGFSMIP